MDRRVLALAVARMADALGNSFLIIVLPLYVASGQVEGDTFGLPTSAVAGLVLALFGIASSLTQPFAGRLSDRLGQRKSFVVVGLVAFCFINVALAWASSYVMLFGLRIAQGIAAALSITASIALVNEVSDGGTRGRNMGLYNAFRLVGFGSGPLAASLLVEAGPFPVPWRAAPVTGFEASFYVAAGGALVSTVLVLLLVRDPEETQPTEDRLALAVWHPTRAWRLDPIFALGLITLVMATCFAMLSAIEPEVNARLDQTPFLFAVEFVALIAALAIVQPFVGRASDRYGRRRFIILGLIGLVPTTLAQGLVDTPTQMIVARALQGIAGAGIFAPALALAGDLAKKGQSGAQLSVLTISFGLGIACGQLLAGSLLPLGFVVPFAVGAVLAGLGLGVVFTQVPRTPALEGTS
jgi:MFS family permease